jgi:hypothetical protein
VRAAAAAARDASDSRRRAQQTPALRAHRLTRKAVDTLLEDPAFEEADVLGMTVGDLLARTAEAAD